MLSSRIRAQLRNQWAGLLALFMVLTGGSAWALDGENTVFSDDIVNGEVKSADVRDDTRNGGGLLAQDLGAGSVGATELDPLAFVVGDISRSTPTSGFQISANAIQSGEVTDGTLTGADIDQSTLGGFDGHDTYRSLCDTPQDNTYADCISVTFELERAMQVLMMVGGSIQHGSYGNSNYASGFCKTTVDGADKITNIGDLFIQHDSVGMPSVFDVISLSAGTHEIALACREDDTDLIYEDLTMAVVELGFE